MIELLAGVAAVLPERAGQALLAWAPAVDNPIPPDVKPDPSVFGSEFTGVWKKLLAGAWGIALIIGVYFLIHGLVIMSGARKSGHVGDLREGKREAVNAAIGLGALCGLTIIVGAITTVVG